MVPQEILLKHYKEYASQPDDWVFNMEQTKRSIVAHILDVIRPSNLVEPVKVTILGASDKRYVPIHTRIFSKLLGKKVVLVTLDIDAKHLGGGKDVIEHDVTKPFPNAPQTVIFSHELMKFLTAEEQLKVLKNSYDALGIGGVAMHIMHEPSIKGTPELRSWQYRVDPDELIRQLQTQWIPAHKLVFDSDSEVDWLRETTVLVMQK